MKGFSLDIAENYATDFTVFHNSEEDIAEKIFLDIRSVFLLLKNRVQPGNFQPAEVIRARTLLFLNDVCQHYEGREALLEMYLASSALNMELDIEVVRECGQLSPEQLADIKARCLQYRRVIEEALRCMC